MRTVMAKLEIENCPEMASALDMTLAEWCSKKLGKAPQGGDVIWHGDFYVAVRKLRRKKPAEAVVSLVPSSQRIRSREVEQA